MAGKRLLAATDLSLRSQRAVQRAALLSRQLAAELCLLHVVDDDQPATIVKDEVRQREAVLAGQAALLRAAAGTPPRAMVVTGGPFRRITATAREMHADLIVLGSHRRRILRDVFVGTTVERVVRTGGRPVLMVNAEPETSYRTALVLTDLSRASAHAIRSARSLGLLDDVEVTVLHVFEPLVKAMMLFASIQRERIEAEVAREAADVQRRLGSFLDALDLGAVRPCVRLEQGPVFQTIRRVVERDRPDLLVIGTRGLTGIKRALLGSVADAVLRGIERDILAVPPSPSRSTAGSARTD